jgi:hypothetical protein
MAAFEPHAQFGQGSGLASQVRGRAHEAGGVPHRRICERERILVEGGQAQGDERFAELGERARIGLGDVFARSEQDSGRHVRICGEPGERLELELRVGPDLPAPVARANADRAPHLR